MSSIVNGNGGVLRQCTQQHNKTRIRINRNRNRNRKRNRNRNRTRVSTLSLPDVYRLSNLTMQYWTKSTAHVQERTSEKSYCACSSRHLRVQRVNTGQVVFTTGLDAGNTGRTHWTQLAHYCNY